MLIGLELGSQKTSTALVPRSDLWIRSASAERLVGFAETHEEDAEGGADGWFVVHQ